MRLFLSFFTLALVVSLSGCSTFERPEFLKLHLEEIQGSDCLEKDTFLLHNLEELEKGVRMIEERSMSDCPKCPPCKPCSSH